jgi:hypothetical protein
MFCLGVALDTGTSIAKVAGVMAALSPATYWDRNKAETRAFVHARVNDTEPEINISCYLAQVRKADAIMDLSDDCTQYEVEIILGTRAFKTKAFFYNILNPVSGLHITIDRHIVAAAGAPNALRSGRATPYRRLESAILNVANAVQRPGPEVQATIWLVVKDIADGVYADDNEPPF